MGNVSVVGLGKLGTPLVAWLASKGHTVVGTDQMQQKVELLARGSTDIQEPGLSTAIMVNHARLRITATHSTKEAVLNSDFTFIIVPTPSDVSGAFVLDYVEGAAREIGKTLAVKDTYHLVVITSTVMPGHSRKIMEILEQESGKKCGTDFGLCYNPLFIALGTVVKNLESPDLVLIGESDSRAGAQLEEFYKELYRAPDPYGLGGLRSKYPVCRMSFESAEIAKLALNVMLVNRIMFGSMLADICQRIPNADVDDVTGAIGCDSRIGPKLLRAGPPPGGPCLPRDTRALLSVCQSITPLLGGIQNQLAKWASDATFSIYTGEQLVYTARERPVLNIGIAGIAYKPGSHITEDSAGLMLADEVRRNHRVFLYDPLAVALGQVRLETFLQLVETICLMLPLEEFKTVDWARTSVKRVIDFWRYLDPQPLLDAGIEYVPYGRSYEYYE